MVTVGISENTPAGNQMVTALFGVVPDTVVMGVKTTEAATLARFGWRGVGTVNATAPIWPPREPADTLALA